MKVLHVVESLEIGGAEMMVVNLAYEQMKAGYEVGLCSLFNGGQLAVNAHDNGIKLYVNRDRGNRLQVVSHLRKTVNEFSPDIINVHNVVCNYYVAFACLNKRGAHIVVTLHGMALSKPNLKRDSLFRASLFTTDRVVCVSTSVYKTVARRFKRHEAILRVIPNGVPFCTIAEASKKSHRWLSGLLGIADDSFILGNVARINKVKNHRLLLDAFDTLSPEKNAHLVIVGDGPDAKEIRSYSTGLACSERIHFMGMRNDVHKIMAGFDCFVLPSRSEGHSIALLEAGAARLPIIATEVGGNPEIINHNVNGILVQPDDVTGLASAIAYMIETDRKGYLADNIRKHVIENFSIDACRRGYDVLYQEMTIT